MASGALVEGGGGGDVPRERNRWIENKVYTRKFYKRKPKNDTNVTDESQAPSSSNAPSVASEDGKKEQQQQQQQEPLATVQENGVGVGVGVASKEDVERPVENGSGSGSGSVQTTESHVNIHLTSMSKEEIRGVKQKLVDELEKIRDLLKQVEAKEMEVNGNGDLDVDGCRVVDVVGVDGSVVVADGMDVSQLSANGDHANDAVVDNGGARSMVSEVNLENGDAKKMVPEVSLDNVYSGRMSTEFSLDDGDAEPMIPEVSLNHGSGRTMMPEVSLDNGDGRRHFSEMDFGNGVARTMTPRANLHNGGVRRMLPVVNVDSYSGSRMGSEVTSLGKREPPRSLHQLRVSVMENNGLNEYADKEKRTPKANQFYQNSDFIVGKEKFPPPSKKLKTNGSRKHGRAGNRAYGFGLVRHSGQVFKHCSSLLTKLMKHRHGWVFNTPVDVEGLRLHDYYLIIKHPMDLGTVKSKLNANFYRSPREFAEDVRLTFRNARTYNPEGQDVHIMAQQLSHIFEERWATMEIEYNLDAWYESYPEVSLPTPVMNKPPYLPSDVGRYIERVDLTPQHTHPKPKAVHYGSSGRGTALKKPKAKDQNKRAMTYDEKQKLSTHLQSLPTEKLDNIVEIIKRRNTSLLQHDNEIEVDIDAVDTETLWELDRFVTNYKKSLSKYKRKAELAMQARQQAELNAQNHTPVAVALSKETKTADEKNTASPQPHQADKQQDNNSRSSSSSSSSSDSSSSSSDSDSDSSSDSDNEQQSPRN